MINKLFGKFKKIPVSKSLLFTTDIHSHLIPGIDDGVKTIEESIEIITALKDLGFKKIITTPHIMLHRFPNSAETILARLQDLQFELKNRQIDIVVEVGAEYYYDEHFLELIEKNELLSFGDKYLLFELSYHNAPLGLEQTIHKLLKAGYKPILAHPERYTYYTQPKHYEMLKDMGLLFQINAISTVGFYGKNVKKAVDQIIRLGMVDFVGSDIHSLRYAQAFEKALSGKSMANITTSNQIKNDYL